MEIQIQLLLKLNLTAAVDTQDNRHSNTTLVKVKSLLSFFYQIIYFIQIQLLLKLNFSVKVAEMQM